MTIIVELTAEETKRVYGAIGLNLTPGTTLRNTVGEGADAIGSAVRINADGSSTCATELFVHPLFFFCTSVFYPSNIELIKIVLEVFSCLRILRLVMSS
jgi:hypothetical protein